MDSKETNAALRSMVNKLIDQGWSKTKIARALLGDSGQGHVNHWLADNDGRVNDFGIKPLTTIANQLKYDVHLVFTPKSDDPKINEIKDQLNEYNTIFINSLSDALVQFLTKKLDEKPKMTPRKTETRLDKVLNSLLGITSPNDFEFIDQSDLAPEEK